MKAAWLKELLAIQWLMRDVSKSEVIEALGQRENVETMSNARTFTFPQVNGSTKGNTHGR